MSLGDDGTLYVGTRNDGRVYALRDTDGDYKIDQKYVLLKDGLMPNGLAFRNGDLYVAEVNRILKFSDISDRLTDPGDPEVVFDGYPTERHHGWKYIAFGPDGRLYVPVGAPCNICKSDEIYASITSINPDGTDLRMEQHGVRNTVGITWHPETEEIWFTDNGRDMLGDDIPACELNHASTRGQHFGYPYCHQGDLPDPDFGVERACKEFTAPAANLGPHTAPLGLEFVKSTMFPEEYSNAILMAEHGSWNRTKKIGYRISMVDEDDGKASNYRPFIDGWLNEESDEVWGRPVDLEWMPDGSLLISDDFADVIYRVTYKG
jgi:glucose/arabinose dehydrogenase